MNSENIPTPISLSKSLERTLKIEWSDGAVHEIPFIALRKGCQCAQCNEERMKPAEKEKLNSGLPILTAAQARPLDIEEMHPVGNYAYNIHFSDGHRSGIFTFELLRGIGEFAAPK
jgi:DUF971 family protein